MNGKRIIVAYDISKNKSRRRVFRVCKQWRLSSQYSVHECLLTENQAQELFIQLGAHIDIKTDSLIMAWIEPHRKVLYRGVGKAAVQNGVWYSGQNLRKTVRKRRWRK